jgi:putative membrane protein
MKLRTNAWMATLGMAVLVTFGCSDANQNQTAADRPVDRAADTNPGSADRGALAGADHEFVMRASQDGMAEIEMGRLAQQRGSSAAVKDFGRRLVEEHTAMSNDLKQAAPSEMTNMPSDLPAEKKNTIEKLSNLNGAEFDREFLNEAVNAHRQAIELFQKQANSGENQTLRNWASSKIPQLQDHLKAAQSLQGGSAKSAGSKS